MRHIATITKDEFIEIVKVVLYSGANLDPEQWRVLDYGDELGTAIRLDAEEYEIRMTWEDGSPIIIFIVAQGHFEALESDKLGKIQQKLQEMGFHIPALETWDDPVTEWDFDLPDGALAR